MLAEFAGGREALASRNVGQIHVEFLAGVTIADFIIVEATLGHRVGEPPGDVGRNIGVAVVPAAAEHQVELAPIGQIPCGVNHGADR